MRGARLCVHAEGAGAPRCQGSALATRLAVTSSAGEHLLGLGRTPIHLARQPSTLEESVQGVRKAVETSKDSSAHQTSSVAERCRYEYVARGTFFAEWNAVPLMNKALDAVLPRHISLSFCIISQLTGIAPLHTAAPHHALPRPHEPACPSTAHHAQFVSLIESVRPDLRILHIMRI